MDSKREVKEFNVLGYNVRLKADESNGEIAPQRIVDLVQAEIEAIKKKAPSLGPGETAVLAALKIASDKLSLDDEYKDSVMRMSRAAKDALNYIEEVSPSTI